MFRKCCTEKDGLPVWTNILQNHFNLRSEAHIKTSERRLESERQEGREGKGKRKKSKIRGHLKTNKEIKTYDAEK